MHTMGPDALHLLELVRGYCAAETAGGAASPRCALSALGITDLLTQPLGDDKLFSLRNLVVVLDDVGQSSPYLAELFAGHYGTALALLYATDDASLPAGSYSLNGSHSQAAQQVTADFESETVTFAAMTELSEAIPAPISFNVFRQSVWLCHSAALLGTLSRIRNAIAQPSNYASLQLAEASARCLVHAAADRHDHALGRGPYSDTLGFGGRYNNDTFTTIMRHSVFTYFDALIEQSEPALADALQVVYSRAVVGFGGVDEAAPVVNETFEG
ncbi:MAG: hypothetical protein WD360_00670 [Nitriliruptoraceae bacterium]